jgi:hypothetical protein
MAKVQQNPRSDAPRPPADRFRFRWLARTLFTWRAFDLVGHTLPTLLAFYLWNFGARRALGK